MHVILLSCEFTNSSSVLPKHYYQDTTLKILRLPTYHSPNNSLPSSPRGGNSSRQSHDPKTLAALRLTRHERAGRQETVLPASKHGFHVSRHTFEHHGADGDERPVLERGGEDAVLLGKEECGAEGVVLRLREGANDAGKMESAVGGFLIAFGECAGGEWTKLGEDPRERD